MLAVKNKAAIAYELKAPNLLLVRSGNKAIILIFSLNQENNSKKSSGYYFTLNLEANFFKKFKY